MTPEEEIRRGTEARQLLEHPLLVESFDLIEREVLQKWKDSPAEDPDGREKLWLTLKLLDKLKGQLKYVMERGEFQQKSLSQRFSDGARNLGERFFRG